MMNRVCLESMFSLRIQLIIRNFFFRKRRKFTQVSCCKCGEDFAREMHLYEHLKIDNRCMAAMGGSVEEARRYVDRMKKQTERENQAKRESDRLISKNWYQANKESRKKGLAAYHEANKESWQKASADWMKGGWWNWLSQFLCQPVRSGFLKQLSQNTTFPQHERSEAERMRGPQRMR